MLVFHLILISVAAGDLIWWSWADRRLRKTIAHPGRWRAVLALFMTSQFLYELYFALFQHSARRVHCWLPQSFIASTFIWHLLALPVALAISVSIAAVRKCQSLIRISASTPQPPPLAPRYSRRQMLVTTAALATPPVLTALGVARAVPQFDQLRVRRIELLLPALPPNLDGLRIAHVSDTHVGRFTTPVQTRRLVESVNRLRADLVLFTGDLIDLSLDDLPRAIDAVRQLDPRHALAIIEGNHDLIEDADAFDARVRRAGLPLLIDETMTISVRGERIRILGMRWGASTGDRRRAGAAAWAQSVNRMTALRDPSAFPILLGHHPHCFDPAVAANFPLVLSGHTHGGQLMLTDNLGAGPVFFRYWSGVYRKTNSQLVVTNGVGNWFPLRINAPAEIIDLTLHRA